RLRLMPPRRRVTMALSVAVASVAASAVIAPGGVSANPVNEITVPSLDSAPTGIAVGPAGTVWFVENTGSAVGRIDSSGKVTEFAVPPDSAGVAGALDSITEGPDGAMWFTDASTLVPRIGRIDPASGTVTTYELPTSG